LDVRERRAADETLTPVNPFVRRGARKDDPLESIMSAVRVRLEVVLDPSRPDPQVIELEVHPDWAPLGAQRFLQLVDCNYYTECRIYRVIPGFICQWGIPASPTEYKKWGDNKIKDDPRKAGIGNTRGMLSFAMSGPDSRGSQLFINYDDANVQLDEQGFTPFAQVTSGMDVAEAVYEETDPAKKIDQNEAKQLGNAYFQRFPKLSYISRAYRVAPS
jgi:cyclophilin family peptidyl-prolyl cis-trans isomerase